MHDLPQQPPQKAFVSFYRQKQPALFGLIVKIPPAQIDVPYQQLLCTELDQGNVYEIISTMAENGKFGLLLKQSHLKEIGAQINHLHPLKFLSIIFTNEYLKSCMPAIFDDYFKRTGFMDGLGPSLTREADKGKLDQYLPSFAEEVNASVEDLRVYAKEYDWENFVRYLILQ